MSQRAQLLDIFSLLKTIANGKPVGGYTTCVFEMFSEIIDFPELMLNFSQPFPGGRKVFGPVCTQGSARHALLYPKQNSLHTERKLSKAFQSTIFAPLGSKHPAVGKANTHNLVLPQ